MTVSHSIVLNRRLRDDLGTNPEVACESDMFGIEIELEGRNIRNPHSADIVMWWDIVNDGSLRTHKPGDDACEYRFKKALNLQDTKTALKVLFSYLNTTPGVKVYDSYRTSIHVHVNFLNDDIRTIVNFLTLSIIFDELLVSQNGETRIGNNFCLRSRDAEGQVNDLITTIKKYGSLYNLSPNDRYSSVNMVSLLKFGTVEFRSLECTTDYDRVIHWVKTLQNLKESAKQYADPREIISKFSRRGPIGFMISHLGDCYPKYAAVDGAQGMLHNGMRLAQDFAFCSNWEPPKEGEKQLPKRARPVNKIQFDGQNWVNNYQQLVAQAQAAAGVAQQPAWPHPPGGFPPPPPIEWN